MKDHEREFLEKEIKLPFKQVAALITTIRILAEDDDADTKDRRVRLTYLLDDVTQLVKERFDKFIDSLYSGGDGGEEDRPYIFTTDRTVNELMHRYGANIRFQSGERASEDYYLLRSLFGVESISYNDGIVRAFKNYLTYYLNIDDENQKVLGICEDENRRCSIGGNADENHT